MEFAGNNDISLELKEQVIYTGKLICTSGNNPNTFSFDKYWSVGTAWLKLNIVLP
jgi:hypothetical protein